MQQLEALPREIFVPYHSIVSYTNKSALLPRPLAPSPPSPTTTAANATAAVNAFASSVLPAATSHGRTTGVVSIESSEPPTGSPSVASASLSYAHSYVH